MSSRFSCLLALALLPIGASGQDPSEAGLEVFTVTRLFDAEGLVSASVEGTGLVQLSDGSEGDVDLRSPTDADDRQYMIIGDLN